MVCVVWRRRQLGFPYFRLGVEGGRFFREEKLAMPTDREVRELWKLLAEGKPLSRAARRCDMDEKTARKYRDLQRLPSELAQPRTHRTREDPFAEVWDEVREQLELNPGLQAKALFEHLCRWRSGMRPLWRRGRGQSVGCRGGRGWGWVAGSGMAAVGFWRRSRWLDGGVAAEMEGGFVEGQAVDLAPEVELISVGAADEAAEDVAVEVDREAAAVAGRVGAVDGTWAAKLTAAAM